MSEPSAQWVSGEGFCGAQALDGLPFVAVTTTKLDKYDRYLADLFYLPEAAQAEAAQAETFLNRALLEAGLAERFSETGADQGQISVSGT